MSDEDLVPRVAVQTHLDGDPRPRPEEVARLDAVRREHGLDEMLVLILLPLDLAPKAEPLADAGRIPLADGGHRGSKPRPPLGKTSQPFPGARTYCWRIFERDGEAICEEDEMEMEIIPDEEVP